LTGSVVATAIAVLVVVVVETGHTAKAILVDYALRTAGSA